MGYYYNQGPNDLFEILGQTFDLLKKIKINIFMKWLLICSIRVLIIIYWEKKLF